jgi:hypothetical protein
MEDISIICIFNDEKIVDEFLIKSLKLQNLPFQLILVNNQNGIYPSAANAFNVHLNQANGDYIMFLHQDISFDDPNFLKKTIDILKELTDLGVAGFAGCSKEKKEIISNIYHGTPQRLAGTIHVDKPVKVQTVDECCFLIPKDLICYLKFDEETCFDWHLYAVEICLNAINRGYSNYVLPMSLYHKSDGVKVADVYFKILKRILVKYHKEIPEIYTTVGRWNQNPILVQKMKFQMMNTIQKHFISFQK